MSGPLAQPMPWDLVAGGYEDVVRPQLEGFAREALRRAPVRDGAKVLDVATGPGTLAVLAAAAGARVTAIDFSSKMIELLRVRAELAAADIDARVADALAMPFESGTFDAAYAMFVYMFVPDRAAALRELRRVLRPGGRAVIATWPPMNRVPLFSAPFDAIRKRVPALPANDGTAPLGDAASLHAELGAAGFIDVAVHEIEHPVEAPSVEEYWESVQRSTAPILLLSKKLGADWGAIAGGVRDDLQATFGDGPLRGTMIANLAIMTAP
jgi:SAM-dependent methyltransferase